MHAILIIQSVTQSLSQPASHSVSQSVSQSVSLVNVALLDFSWKSVAGKPHVIM